MHCYNHADREAVGTCKACCRGLCSECAKDLGFGLSCHGPHEQRVAEIEEIITRNASVQRAAGRARYAAPALYLFMGILFAGFGGSRTKADLFLLTLGSGMIAFGMYCLWANRRAYARRPDSAPTSQAG